MVKDRVAAVPHAGVVEFKWLPFPPDLWVPAGLKDFQEAWFVNLLRASLRSENPGYLILCKEGCSGCPACLWRVANAHHPEHFKKHSSLVLACFNSAQIAGHQVLYFPKLVETVNRQLSRMKNHRSLNGVMSETSTGFNKSSGVCSPSISLSFDFDSDSNKERENLTTSNTQEGSTPVIKDSHNLWDKNVEQENPEITESAKRILNILELPNAFFSAATAAVKTEAKQTNVSMDGVVHRVVTAANLAQRRGVPRAEFLEDFLAQASARGILENVNLPITNNFVLRVAAVLKAEMKDTGLPTEEAANCITRAAFEDRRRGMKIDIFYFEDVRWRSNGRATKAEQRKRANLAANARAKEILREQLH